MKLCQSLLLRRLFLLCLLGLSVGRVSAQETDYTLHAKYIFRFTTYLDWPAERKAGPFIIGVCGSPELLESIKKICEGRKVRNQQVLVINIAPEDDPGNCHILVMSKGQSRNIDRFLLKIGGRAVLIIGERAGLAQRGADINFVVKDEFLRFELNVGNCQSKGLRVATDLIKLSYRID